MVGEALGNYRITRVIGEGGMGTVYLAEHTLLGRHAAIKVLLPELCHRAELVTRFFNEARAASTVQHPGIVEIFDFGHHRDGSAFIVMELLQGESLAARLRRVRVLPETLAASYVRQMCSGLAAAHAKGIVHRDVKPDNVFLVPDPIAIHGERIKILDFGIAKLAAEQLLGSMRTRTGTVLGTPTYMSPEQCRGVGEVDHRSDLYSLGCLLYTMVCGRPPFVSEGMGDVMAKHIYEPVTPPSTLVPISPGFEQVVLRALAKNPAARYSSADELAAALERARPTGSFAVGTPATPPPLVSAPTPTTPRPSRPSRPSRPPTPATPLQRHLSATTPMEWPAAMTTPSTPVLSVPPTAATRSRRRWPLAAGAAVAGAIVLSIAFLSTGPSAETTTAAETAQPGAPEVPAATTPRAPEVPAAATTPRAPEAPAAAPAADAPSPTITLRITSTPPGADVYRMPARERVGITPYQVVLLATPGEVTFLVERRGHRSETVAFPADRDGEKEIRLRARPAPPPGQEAPPPGQEAPPPAPGTTLNPFER